MARRRDSRDEGPFRRSGPVPIGPHDLRRFVRRLGFLEAGQQELKSVKRRIATLMDQLDTLSGRLSTTGLRVILTQTVDVTFLGFKAGGQDKDTVRILEE